MSAAGLVPALRLAETAGLHDLLEQRPAGWCGLVRAVRSPTVLLLMAIFGVYAAQYLTVVGLLPAVLVAGEGLS